MIILFLSLVLTLSILIDSDITSRFFCLDLRYNLYLLNTGCYMRWIHWRWIILMIINLFVEFFTLINLNLLLSYSLSIDFYVIFQSFNYNLWRFWWKFITKVNLRLIMINDTLSIAYLSWALQHFLSKYLSTTGSLLLVCNYLILILLFLNTINFLLNFSYNIVYELGTLSKTWCLKMLVVYFLNRPKRFELGV